MNEKRMTLPNIIIAINNVQEMRIEKHHQAKTTIIIAGKIH